MYDVALSNTAAQEIHDLLRRLGTLRACELAQLIEEEMAYAQRRQQEAQHHEIH